MKFNELPLGPKVLQGVLNASFTSCMSVQELVLPQSLQGKDVMVQSKTGSAHSTHQYVAKYRMAAPIHP